MRGGLSISQGTNIVTLPLRKREETGNTKLFLKLRDIHLLDWLNNSVIFKGKPMGLEEFLNRMIKSLDIIIDRSSKGRPRKMKS